MIQPTVFVSYSHKDEDEKAVLLSHLAVLEHAGLPVGAWSDDRIKPGADWEDEITEAMEQASVTILLISSNSLTSDFILRKEVRRLLERRASEGLTIFPVIATACAWRKVPWLRKMNVRPKNGTAIWRAGDNDIDQDLADITEEVADIIESKLRSQLQEAQASNDFHQIVEISAQILKSEPDDKKDLQVAVKAAEEQLNIAKHREEAQVAFNAEQYDKAIVAWEKLLDLDADDEKAKAGLAEAEKQQGIQADIAAASAAAEKGDHQAALEAWERVRAAEPNHAEAQAGVKEAEHRLELDSYREQARDAFKERRYDDAIGLWEKVLDSEPEDDEAKGSVARIQSLSKIRQRLTELEEAVAAGKDKRAVQKWKAISPLLSENALSAYDEQIAGFERDIKQRDDEASKFKATIKDLTATVASRGRRINKLERELREAQDGIESLQSQAPAPEIITPNGNAKMVLIPAGEFLMGSPDGEGKDNEHPQHKVVLDPFYMDIYPVTNAQYRQFVKETGYQEPTGRQYIDAKWIDGFEPWKDSKFNGDNQPVVCVSCRDAMAYCKWAEKILPTEAQWEYAARGGMKGETYPWTGEPGKTKANYGQNVGHTTPVDQYPENGYGLYNMAGNVWEWCLDKYEEEFGPRSDRGWGNLGC